MSAIDELAAARAAKARDAYAVKFTDSKPPRLVLPDAPAADDLAGCCAWLTNVLRLDQHHPVTGAVRQGRPGPDAHVEIRRAGATPIRFEPVAVVSSARRLLPILVSQLQPTDDERYSFKDEHARRIAHVLLRLCGAAEAASAEQETAAIVGTFLASAEPIERHTTYGTTEQRYEAAVALQRATDEHTGRPVGAARYLVDANTGELVIRVSDLQEAARRHEGSSLPRGWLDARMAGLGWDRVTLQGYGLPGRAGRRGPHARCATFRGHLPAVEDGAVNT